MTTDNEPKIDWGFLAQKIKDKKCIPFISNRVSNRYLFPDQDIVKTWAEKIEYPFADNGNLAQVAQYQRVMTGERQAKFNYLDFLKQQLWDAANAKVQGRPHPFLVAEKDHWSNLTLSQLALDLESSQFEAKDNPWHLLAKLSLPIYVTTSFHTFMAEALTAMGRSPQIAVYCWSDDLVRSSVIKKYPATRNLVPTETEPLVFHLYGIDRWHESLVFTEDNFFEFLEHIDRDLTQIDNDQKIGVPEEVRRQLSEEETSVLLLGYNLHDWDFRVAFRSAIQNMGSHQRDLSLIVLFEPGLGENLDSATKDRIRNYLTKYANNNHFNVYWCGVQQFLAQICK